MDSGLEVAISIYVCNLDLELRDRDSMVNCCCKIGEFGFLSSGAL